MGKVKIFAKAACFKNLFIIGDGESFGNWDVQKVIKNILFIIKVGTIILHVTCKYVFELK